MRKKLVIAATSRLSFRSNHKPLSFELSDSVGPSYIQWRGWSYAAAAVPSDTPEPHKGRKKITKHERRAMVESFVNKYRTTNAGKFPTVSEVQKQVGGCYYYLRRIVQELQYQSKMNSSNSFDKNLLEKEQCPKVSSDNTGAAKDRPIQNDSQLVPSNDHESIDGGYEHLEQKRGSQISSYERRLSKEVKIISTPGNHCLASESNLLEKCSGEPYPSNLQMLNDVQTEEAVSSYSDGVARPATHLPQEGEHVSSPFSDKGGTVYGKASGHESEFVDTDNHLKMEESCIEKAGYERREQATLEDLYKEPSHSSMQVPNNAMNGKDVSTCSFDFLAPERHFPKKEVENFPASLIEKPDSNHRKAQSYDSESVDMEYHRIVVEEKSFKTAGYERKEQDALDNLSLDGLNQKMKQSQGSAEFDASKAKPNYSGTNAAVVSEKSTFWGNLKSFADGVINIWRKL